MGRFIEPIRLLYQNSSRSPFGFWIAIRSMVNRIRYQFCNDDDYNNCRCSYQKAFGILVMTSKIDFLCDDLTIEFPFLDGNSRSFKARFRGLHSVESSIIGLNRINIKIKVGSHLLIGRNGAGKSTLLRTLAGVYVPTKGHIEINTKLQIFEVGVGVDQMRTDTKTSLF